MLELDLIIATILLSIVTSIIISILSFLTLEKIKSWQAGPKLVLLRPTSDWKFDGPINIWLTNIGNVTTTFQGTIEVLNDDNMLSEHFFNEYTYRCSYSSFTGTKKDDITKELSGPIAPGETIKIPLAVDSIHFIDIDIHYFKKDEQITISKSYFHADYELEMQISKQRLVEQKFDEIREEHEKTSSK